MKIKETIERECCEPGKDLIKYEIQSLKDAHRRAYYFCKHCGRQWEECRQVDPVGLSGTALEKLPWPWESVR